MKKVSDTIKEFEKNGISDIQLIAFISDTSREVVFYGKIDGVSYQSNNMVEEGKISADIIDGFYDEITSIIRSDERFKSDKMNIIKADTDSSKVEYDEKNVGHIELLKSGIKKMSDN